MTIAFYKVCNSQNYGRHEFDYIYDERKAIMEKLSKLGEEECRYYDMSTIKGACWFVEDYNDEIIDGKEWWCVIIPG